MRTLRAPAQGAETLSLPGEDTPLLSVVVPCLNEAPSIQIVVRKALETMQAEGIDGEVVVADNGSTDGSPELARAAGARVVREPRTGYGSAYLAGFEVARGKYILMGDADDTYDFTQLGRFIAPLDDGADLVIGNRFAKIHPGAMPWLHRYVGNPMLTGMLNLLFRTGVRDAHCGMRAFRRDLLPALNLRTTGMEFASEHVIRAGKLGLDIRNLDIEYHPRKGRSKLSSFSDGWRHLRFLLLTGPTSLFFVPGALLLLLGALVELTVVADLTVLGREWGLHALIGGSLLMIVGAQLLQLGLFARTYATYYLDGRGPDVGHVPRVITLERGLIVGGLVFAVGCVVSAVVTIIWIDHGFGELREEQLAVVGLTFVVLGAQVLFGGFVQSVLSLRRRPAATDGLVDS